MTNNTTATGRKVMSITAFVFGLIFIGLVPKMAMDAQAVILMNVYKFIEAAGNPALMAAPKMVTFWYPFWSAFTMMAGVVLILIAGSINRGEYWARPIALGMTAIPCIAGAALIGPIVKFALTHIMTSVSMMLLGLIPFLIILLYEQASMRIKSINFFVFMAIGLTTAWNFGNFHGGFRIMWSFIINDPRIVVQSFAVGTGVMLVGVILAMVGIPLLAARTRAGWWLLVTANGFFFVGTGRVLIGNLQTLEFYVGTAAGLIVLALLLSPKIGGQLVDHRPLLSLKPMDESK